MTGGVLWPLPCGSEDGFRAEFAAAAERVRGLTAPAVGLKPRGIIIPAGGARMFTCAWVAIRVLRERLGCTLPIQVWHIGRAEMSDAMSALLAEHQVETVDARGHAGEGVPLGGFELKSLALLHCPFREVILLDADNVPVIDPAVIFDSEDFRAAGAMFWPDLVAVAQTSRIWELCGVPWRHMPSFETGQIAVDRQRHLPALALSWFMNRNSHIVYRHIYGDKDCFLLAWLALDAPFHLVRTPVRRLQGSLCQHHPDGRRLFQHRSLRKWKLHGDNPAITGFEMEKECLAYLDELRALWNGRVFNPPPADPEMLALAAEIVAQRHYRLETVSMGTADVAFLPHNRLLRSTGPGESWWIVRDGDGDGGGRELALKLGEDHVVNRRFRRLAAGYWRSPAAAGDSQDLILTAAPAPERPSGHNSANIAANLKYWRANYEDLPQGGV